MEETAFIDLLDQHHHLADVCNKADVCKADDDLQMERGPCYRYHCDFGAQCVLKGGSATCDCPTCTEEFEPVCGTDGISYTNNCKLRREACEQK
ncbi:hypothetical protein CEXT_776851 [Caerostris extrusa]|uniref:Kazal-like domain-containing protein n=1 Tax=Caerostris extrusa TaxID=172846 RepID=A0AAV4TJ04_CAEEX|nr:hypothetical protein CEXT_776851 [Caerostris extrusa]